MAHGFVLRSRFGFRPVIEGKSFLWIGEICQHEVIAKEAIEESAPVVASIIAEAMREVSQGAVIN